MTIITGCIEKFWKRSNIQVLMDLKMNTPKPHCYFQKDIALKEELFIFPDLGGIYVNRSLISIFTSFKDFLSIFGANES